LEKETLKLRKELRSKMGSRVSRRQGTKTRAGLKEIKQGKRMRPRTKLKGLIREHLNPKKVEEKTE
jgi:hypothetical protein